MDVVGFLGSNVATITAGSYRTCVLTTAGGVKCWGANYSGELGDGTMGNIKSTPVDVVGLGSGVDAIAAGGTHTCALTVAGGVKCWGRNEAGQLGDGMSSGYFNVTPGDVVGLDIGIAAIAAGVYHTCALSTAGGVKCWGANVFGQLGDGTTGNKSIPVDVVGLGSGVAVVAAGDGYTCALITAGGVKCWGSNDFGQLGDGTSGDGANKSTPVDVVGLGSGVAAIAAGGSHTCALSTAGRVMCWGRNEYGQLGDGTTADKITPVEVAGLGSGVAAIAAGGFHTCALTIQGGVKCWGWNLSGQLGDSTGGDRFTPTDVVGLGSSVTAITAGAEHTCVVTLKGGAMCWGSNEYGQLGDGSTTNKSTPMDVVSAAAVSAGGSYTCALTTAGGVKCWGNNSSGQLGDGSMVNKRIPVDVVGLDSGVDAIAAGGSHTCVTVKGGVKCWGNKGSGQLGDGSVTDPYVTYPFPSNSIVDVVGLDSGVAAVAAGRSHTCALTVKGGVKCWGNNGAGQLGDGTGRNSSTPVDVVSLDSGIAAIAAGGFHTCALTTAGGVKCWGWNLSGQLGDGTGGDRLTPVDVVGLGNGIAAITAGAWHTCALTIQSGVKCWGSNFVGQLGDGSMMNKRIPVDVVGLDRDVADIDTHSTHTCALTTAGGVKCWGRNEYGQLGDGDAWSTTPVDVIGLSEDRNND